MLPDTRHNLANHINIVTAFLIRFLHLPTTFFQWKTDRNQRHITWALNIKFQTAAFCTIVRNHRATHEGRINRCANCATAWGPSVTEPPTRARLIIVPIVLAWGPSGYGKWRWLSLKGLPLILYALATNIWHRPPTPSEGPPLHERMGPSEGLIQFCHPPSYHSHSHPTN